MYDYEKLEITWLRKGKQTMVADHAVGAANYAIPQNLQSYRIRTLAPKWCLRAAMYLNCKCEHITLSIK